MLGEGCHGSQIASVRARPDTEREGVGPKAFAPQGPCSGLGVFWPPEERRILKDGHRASQLTMGTGCHRAKAIPAL